MAVEGGDGEGEEEISVVGVVDGWGIVLWCCGVVVLGI